MLAPLRQHVDLRHGKDAIPPHFAGAIGNSPQSVGPAPFMPGQPWRTGVIADLIHRLRSHLICIQMKHVSTIIPQTPQTGDGAKRNCAAFGEVARGERCNSK